MIREDGLIPEKQESIKRIPQPNISVSFPKKDTAMILTNSPYIPQVINRER